MKDRALYVRVSEDFMLELVASLVRYNETNSMSLNVSQYVRLILTKAFKDDGSQSTN